MKLSPSARSSAALALLVVTAGCSGGGHAGGSSQPAEPGSSVPATIGAAAATLTQTTVTTNRCHDDVTDGDTVAAAGPGLTFHTPLAVTGFALDSADGSTHYDVTGTKALLYDREDQPTSFTATSTDLAGITDTEPFLPGSATPLVNESFDAAQGDLVPVFEFTVHWTGPDKSGGDAVVNPQATLTLLNADGSQTTYTYPTKISLYRAADKC